MKLYYQLTVTVPDEIDAGTFAEISTASEPHDLSERDKIERWIGGFVDDAGNILSSWLPEGWSARVDS